MSNSEYFFSNNYDPGLIFNLKLKIGHNKTLITHFELDLRRLAIKEH